jgi:hypothetical protein
VVPIGTIWKNDGGSEYEIVPQNTVGCSAYRFLEFKKKTKGGNALYRTRNAEREYEGGTLGDFLSGPHASNDTHIFHPFHPYWATMWNASQKIDVSEVSSLPTFSYMQNIHTTQNPTWSPSAQHIIHRSLKATVKFVVFSQHTQAWIKQRFIGPSWWQIQRSTHLRIHWLSWYTQMQQEV